MEVEFMAEFTDHMSRDRARKIVKGKRTKRQRPSSSFGDSLIDNSTPDQSPIRSSELSSSEEEDMANCLIMLAQSVSPVKEAVSESDPIRQKTEKLSSSRFTETITGSYVYQCKTCNRTFPSFQALGGHRASHKKPKLNVEDKKCSSVSVQSSNEETDQHKTVVIQDKENTLHMTVNNNNNVLKCPSPLPGFIQPALTNNKIKLHECSICGSEYSSGQALGGHMRKHRPVAPSVNRITESVTEKLPGGGTSCTLSLDLNFPPPEVVDDVVQSKFKFTAGSSQQHMVFSAPALVDCHY